MNAIDPTFFMCVAIAITVALAWIFGTNKDE